jgi:hypothetical protein
MKVQTRTIYKCDYCPKRYLSEGPAVKHEKYCRKNPANKHVCFQCVHLSVEREHNDDGFNEKTFTCTKLDKQLHTVTAERIGHSCLGHTERMPISCEAYEIEQFYKPHEMSF